MIQQQQQQQNTHNAQQDKIQIKKKQKFLFKMSQKIKDTHIQSRQYK